MNRINQKLIEISYTYYIITAKKLSKKEIVLYIKNNLDCTEFKRNLI